jgi:sigma-B regulation protein RsbQ
MPGMSIFRRNNINITGTGAKTMLFAHGFGCDQNMWRLVAPAFKDEYRIVLFDHVGAGKSDSTQYEHRKYDSLEGYADDLLEIIGAVSGTPVVFVGHSVSAIIGILAAKKQPESFDRLVLIGPSPSYIDEGNYRGGFSKDDIDSLLESMDSNYFGWSSNIAPTIMGNPERPQLAAELTESFCRTDPEIARHFARVTFLSDNRGDLAGVDLPALVMQCSQDVIAPDCVGEFVEAHLPRGKMIKLQATGHCPHLSAPEETIAAMRKYLALA